MALPFAISTTCFNTAPFLSWYPISQPPSFLFQAMCMALLPMPHPPFSLCMLCPLYPWQPMISFSPELGARPRARRGVWFWHGERQRERGENGESIGFNICFYISQMSTTFCAEALAAEQKKSLFNSANTLQFVSPFGQHILRKPHTMWSCLLAAVNHCRCASLAQTLCV